MNSGSSIVSPLVELPLTWLRKLPSVHSRSPLDYLQLAMLFYSVALRKKCIVEKKLDFFFFSKIELKNYGTRGLFNKHYEQSEITNFVWAYRWDLLNQLLHYIVIKNLTKSKVIRAILRFICYEKVCTFTTNLNSTAQTLVITSTLLIFSLIWGCFPSNNERKFWHNFPTRRGKGR